MAIKLLYFASLRDALGLSEEKTALPGSVVTVAELRAHLASRGGEWSRLVTNNALRCAVNQEMASSALPINDGDEVAFFPPVTGG
ncbi:molybdopterin synthase sulfur carrier subunit [Sulfurimicrobium lacus]|uniref:Molybdopterin synthase sulfur carrier subunit n=1 Tax=Sulfurimicrobium lacus TaxID=2715678 RepID=A0A6F8VEE9_9PROT|nr:molybdopterin converting factor subunit 1 [Sulfurimicrobium lacus]BCB27406.1 molybdopterin synthase sulfur carrier subunit [Sulfurimicrobium lacus]